MFCLKMIKPLILWLNKVNYKLYNFLAKTKFIGKTAVFLPNCESTNTFAAQFATENSVENGTVFYTFCQTKGRGQRGNSWESADNENITVSVLVQPIFLKPSQQWFLSMAVAVASANVLEHFLQQQIHVKWPNDLYVGNQKIGGILIENVMSSAQISQSIIGIGINVNQLKFVTPNAVSMAQLSYKKFDLKQILEAIFENLENEYLKLKQGEYQSLKANYHSRLFLHETWAKFRADGVVFDGKITAVTDQGQLQMETETGVKHFDFKQVEFIF